MDYAKEVIKREMKRLEVINREIKELENYKQKLRDERSKIDSKLIDLRRSLYHVR